MTKLSLSAFGKTHGVSKQAAAKWRLRGHLVMDGDLVDVEASDKRLRDALLGRYKRAPGVRMGKTTAEARAPVAAIVEALSDAPMDDDTLTRFVEDLTAGRVKTLAEANAVKENALALKHSLEALRLSSTLVETGTAEKVLFEQARGARDAWLNFASKIGPLLAADLKVPADAVVEALTAHVHRQIEELGDPTPDFDGGDE